MVVLLPHRRALSTTDSLANASAATQTGGETGHHVSCVEQLRCKADDARRESSAAGVIDWLRGLHGGG